MLIRMQKEKKKKKNPNGLGSIYKRSDGMWIGAICIPGEDGKLRRKTVSAKDRNLLLEKFSDLRKEIDAGVVVLTPATTVGVWLDHWLEDIVKPHKTPMTVRSYEQAIRLYIKPHIGTKRLNRLTPDHIRVMEKAAQQKSPRFAQLAHAVLSKALGQALKDGKIGRNPILAVEPPKYLPKVRAAFTAEVATTLIQKAFARGHIEGCMWAMAFTTGTRKAELLGLEWSRVDLDKGVVDLGWQLLRMKKGWTPPAGFEARQCSGTLWWTKPKSKAGSRVVPLLPLMMEALKALKELDTGDNPHGLVWHHQDGRPISPETFHTAWKELLAEAGVDDAPAHAIRHTTATLLQAAGVDDQTRELLLGHSSAAMTRLYVHIDQSRQRAAVQGGLTELMPST
jgi:integrase